MGKRKSPTVIDLFAGCGGLTSGFVSEGFEPLIGIEWDPSAAATYASNFGQNHIICGDITNWPDEDIPSADVVIGGPPCQGFSGLGRRDMKDPRNKLWQEFVRVVAVARPKIFVIENVDRFRTSEEFALLEREINAGALTDYTVAHAVLLAADYGTAQRRRRTILVGSRIGLPLLPPASHGQGGVGVEPWRTVRDAFEGVPFETHTLDLPKRQQSIFGSLIAGPFKSHEIHLGRRPTPLSLSRYDCIPPGGNRFDLPDELLSDCWRNKLTGTTDVMGRMRWDSPSLTIRTEFFKPEKGQYLHPQWDEKNPRKRVNRAITHLEAARLQGFPDEFLWCGSRSEIARQIGNAVPVPLAQAIAAEVKRQLAV